MTATAHSRSAMIIKRGQSLHTNDHWCGKAFMSLHLNECITQKAAVMELVRKSHVPQSGFCGICRNDLILIAQTRVVSQKLHDTDLSLNEELNSWSFSLICARDFNSQLVKIKLHVLLTFYVCGWLKPQQLGVYFARQHVSTELNNFFLTKKIIP